MKHISNSCFPRLTNNGSLEEYLLKVKHLTLKYYIFNEIATKGMNLIESTRKEDY